MKNKSQLNRERYIKPLTEWVEQTIENRLWEKYNDLHIDVLDEQFQKPGRWVEASLFLLSCLRDMVDRSKYKVLLAIPLAASDSPVDVDTLHPNKLEESLSDTPPSFYLYPTHFSVFDETLRASLYVSSLSRLMQHEVYFKEKEEDKEYYSWLFVK